jgi:dTDP-4-dehydrorhamnose 3,5-epimerase
MKITSTKLQGVQVAESVVFDDNRGSFSRWFCPKELASVLDGRSIGQINHSVTLKKGSIRGMHFQKPPHSEMKFVRCIRGRVLDIALDLRAGSKTFLQWHAEELTPGNHKMLVIPERCAHGFQILEEGTELLYIHTGFYEPSSEGGVNYSDPKINIEWPLPVGDISERDAKYPILDDGFKGF